MQNRVKDSQWVGSTNPSGGVVGPAFLALLGIVGVFTCFTFLADAGSTGVTDKGFYAVVVLQGYYGIVGDLGKFLRCYL